MKKHLNTTNLAWVGVVLLQGATLPSTIQKIMGVEGVQMPPVTMVLMVWAGLLCYMIRAIVQKDVVYMVSNGIGIVLNTIMLALIVFPHN